MVLSITRYISYKPTNVKEANEVLFLMKDLSAHMEKHKKSIIKTSIIQSLERIVQPLDFTGNFKQDTWNNSIFSEVNFQIFQYFLKIVLF